MLNPSFVARQLEHARRHIQEVLDVTAGEIDQAEDAAIPPVGGPDPLARSMALAMTVQKQIDQGRVIVSLTDRLDKLTKLLLDIAPDACARHDLFGF
jgi:hypothetical protein